MSYQWYRDGTAIGSATSSTYMLDDADVGAAITVEVSYADGQGFAETIASAATSAVTASDDGDGTVTITGTAQEDSVLTANFADDDPDGAATGVSYQWYRDGAQIDGANGETYALGDADVGAAITVEVSYTDGQGTERIRDHSAATGLVGNVNDLPTGGVTITGTAQEGETLTADTTGLADADELGTLHYQWQRDDGGGFADVGLDQATYTLGEDDVGAVFQVIVSYEDGQGTAETVTSSATGTVAASDDGDATVTITGSAQEDSVLTANFADDDPDGAATGVSYQWYRDGAQIDGANGETYALGDADVGAAITVEVSYTDGQGTEESVASAATGLVGNVNDLPTGGVTITGTATQGQVLTAGTGTLADVDGLGTLHYQWQRNSGSGFTTVGLDQATYTLGAADVGAVIRVIVSYTDARGTPESATSTATAAIGGTAITNGNAGGTITGTSGDNVIDAQGGNDTVNAGAGNDTVTGGTGRDTVNAGDGDDTIIATNGDGSLDAYNGGTGTDTLDMSAITAPATINLALSLVSSSQTGIDTLSSIENAIGGSGNDTITGNSAANRLDGRGGNDTINAGSGNDFLIGGTGSDTMNGDAGNDSMNGDAGNDAMNGGSGNDAMSGGADNDTMNGGADSDTMYGDAGNDTMNGGSGNDFLTGGIGNDTMNGDAGNDIFRFAAGFGNDRINGFDANPAGGGQDRLDISAFGITAATFTARVAIADVGADTLVTIDGQTITLVGIGNATTITQADFVLGA